MIWNTVGEFITYIIFANQLTDNCNEFSVRRNVLFVTRDATHADLKVYRL